MARSALLAAIACLVWASCALAQEPDPQLGLTISANGDLGALVPATERDYIMSLSALASSSAAQTSLSVVDPSPTAPGHLVNGTFPLPQPLQLMATDAAHPTGTFAPLGSAPLPLLTFAGPVTQDPVTVLVKQSVAATDTLLRGSYGKSLTFTLTAVQP